MSELHTAPSSAPPRGRMLTVLIAVLALVAATVGFTSVSDAQTATGDRYGTAALLALEAYPDGADVVFVASGENFPDALAAAQLSWVYDGPIVLTRRDSIPASTAAALEELNPGDVIVLGGTAAVGQAVFNELAGGPWQATRFAGANRYDTAALFALDAAPNGADTVFIASGENFPDALAAAPLQFAYGAPLLLTQRNALPAETAAALDELEPLDVVILGGPAAVSEAVAEQLAAGPWDTYRFAGSNRYDTAAEFAMDAYPDGADVVFIASGENFPDALAAAPLAGAMDGPILLVQRNAVPAETAAALQELAPGDVILLGGTGAISQAVFNELAGGPWQASRYAG